MRLHYKQAQKSYRQQMLRHRSRRSAEVYNTSRPVEPLTQYLMTFIQLIIVNGETRWMIWTIWTVHEEEQMPFSSSFGSQTELARSKAK